MNEAEKYLERFEFDIFNRSPIYEKVDLIKFAQAYADEQLKKKMPSDEEIDKFKNLNKRGEKRSDNIAICIDIGITWLKQQILKP